MKNSLFMLILFLVAFVGGVWYVVAEIGDLFTGLYAEIDTLETNLERSTSLVSQLQDAHTSATDDISRLSDLVDEQDRMIESIGLQLSQ